MKNILQDKYVLGQSVTKQIQAIGGEIRLDLSLQPSTKSVNSGKVTGLVTDINGLPIPGALINIMSSTYDPLVHAVTDATGSYTFNDIMPSQTYNIFAISSGTKLNQGTSFTMSAYETVTKNFTLEADPNALLGIIVGDLKDSATGLPVAGAVATLYSVDSAKVERILGVTYTNESGQFSFRQVGRSNAVVKITALGYYNVQATTLVNQPGQIVPMTVMITPNPTTSRGTVSGVITDNANHPLSGADVILYRSNTDNSLTPVAFTKTNANGIYLFVNVPGGSYKVISNQSEITTIDVTDPWTSSPDYDLFVFARKGRFLGLSFSMINGTMSNGAALTLGDKFVGNLGGVNNGAVSLNISVPQAAKYAMRIKYVAGDADKTLKIDVDGVNTGTTYTLTKTAGATAADAQTFIVTLYLDAGVHTVKFYNTTDPAPILGDLTFIASAATAQVAATSGVMQSGAVLASVAGFVSGIGDAGGTLTVTANVPLAGSYTLGIQHLNSGAAKPLTLNVNGVVGTQLSLPATTTNNLADAQVYETPITLNKGNNTIVFFNAPNASAPWVGNLTFTQSLYSQAIQAESGTLAGTATINGGVVTNINSNGGSLTITVNVPAADEYDMLIKYYTDAANTMCNIDINGVSTGETYSFAANPISSPAVDYRYMRVLLKSGSNTLRFYTI